jgi:peroxiredoxin
MKSTDRAPDFLISRSGGPPLSLSRFAGHPLVLWFGGARGEAFRTDQLAWYNRLVTERTDSDGKRLDSDGELLGITVDGAWCELQFRHRTVRVGLVTDLPLDGPVARAYGVEGSEAIFVIDAGGTIQWRYLSPTSARPPVAAMLAMLARTASEPDPGPPGRRDFIAATLAATFVLASRPTVGRADPVSVRVAPLPTAGAPRFAVTRERPSGGIEPGQLELQS